MRPHDSRVAGKRAVAVAALTALAVAPAAFAQDPVSDYTPPTVDYKPPPATGISPITERPARATARGPQRCVDKTFPVTVNGKRMARITFTVNGKGRRTVSAKGRARLRVSLRARGGRAQRVKAVVTFKAQSTPARKTLRVVAFRCAPARISPSFTG